MDYLVVLIAVLGPFLVWPIELLLPYPYIVEELFKFILVYFFAKKSAKPFIYAGIAFALTETVFYSLNINTFGNINLFFVRFMLTSILHSITFLTIYYSWNFNKKLITVGFILAAFIHFLYNIYIPYY